MHGGPVAAGLHQFLYAPEGRGAGAVNRRILQCLPGSGDVGDVQAEVAVLAVMPQLIGNYPCTATCQVGVEIREAARQVSELVLGWQSRAVSQRSQCINMLAQRQPIKQS